MGKVIIVKRNNTVSKVVQPETIEDIEVTPAKRVTLSGPDMNVTVNKKDGNVKIENGPVHPTEKVLPYEMRKFFVGGM